MEFKKRINAWLNNTVKLACFGLPGEFTVNQLAELTKYVTISEFKAGEVIHNESVWTFISGR